MIAQKSPRLAAKGHLRRSFSAPSFSNSRPYFASAKTPLEQAKEAFDVPRLWDALGLSGKPSRSCKSPFRDERNASFSVAPDGRTWHDFATGESGDVVAFLSKALGCDFSTAAKELIRMNGGPACVHSMVPKTSASKPTEHPKAPILPTDIHKGSQRELNALSALRGLSLEGLLLTSEAGVLRFGTVKGFPAWLVVSSCGRNAQARRLDGLPWPMGAKAYTLPHAQASIPIGWKGLKDCACAAIMEGAPDLLACYCLCHAEGRNDVAPIGMLGASTRIHADCLPHFKGKAVRIFAHADSAGANAAKQWHAQLRQVGAKTITALSFPAHWRTSEGAPVKDLNDFLHLNVDLWESLANRDVLPIKTTEEI